MNENIVIVEKFNFLSRGRSLVKMVQIRLGETGESIKVYLKQISSLWEVKEIRIKKMKFIRKFSMDYFYNVMLLLTL